MSGKAKQGPWEYMLASANAAMSQVQIQHLCDEAAGGGWELVTSIALPAHQVPGAVVPRVVGAGGREPFAAAYYFRRPREEASTVVM